MTTTADPTPARWRWVGIVLPAVLAFFQVAGTVGGSERQTDRRDLDVLAIVLALAGPAALLVVRRHPVPVLWFVTGVTLTYLLRGYAYGPIILSAVVAVVMAIVLGHRAMAWAAAATLYAGHFALGTVLRDEDWSWMAFGAVAAWAVVVLAVGELIRVRRERAIAARRAREETERRQANEERLRIARELHDVVAHHMSLINVQAGVALHLVDRQPEQARTALSAIKDASKEALTELRSLVDVLRAEGEAAPRSPTAMLGTLDELVERSRHAGLDVRTRIEGERRPLPTAVELAAFRIVQEAITNVVRHADARHADIVIGYGADELSVRIDDDGRGGMVDSQGNGIRGMRERAAALGGTVAIGSAPAGGVRVHAVLPLGAPA